MYIENNIWSSVCAWKTIYTTGNMWDPHLCRVINHPHLVVDYCVHTYRDNWGRAHTPVNVRFILVDSTLPQDYHVKRKSNDIPYDRPLVLGVAPTDNFPYARAQGGAPSYRTLKLMCWPFCHGSFTSQGLLFNRAWYCPWPLQSTRWALLSMAHLPFLTWKLITWGDQAPGHPWNVLEPGVAMAWMKIIWRFENPKKRTG